MIVGLLRKSGQDAPETSADLLPVFVRNTTRWIVISCKVHRQISSNKYFQLAKIRQFLSAPHPATMVSLSSLSLLGLALAPVALAHFKVNVPAPWNGNIDNEDTSPCGGGSPTASSADFHVGGDAIGIQSLHAQSFIAYRGLLGTSVSSPNWTVLMPTIEQFGLNGFCEPSISVPESWAGSKGVLQVIQDAEDGVHFQV